MRKILVGQSDRIMGTVGVGACGEWILAPKGDVAPTDLERTVNRVFHRVQRSMRGLTRPQFIRLFFAKGGPPATVNATGAWGKAFVPSTMSRMLNQFLPKDDPYLAKLRRLDEETIAQTETFQHV